MSHFGWNNWKRLFTAYKNGQLKHGLEREVLKYLHRESSLHMLARFLRTHLPNWCIRVDSIWVDGTPQASFTDVAGTANCELADLLLIVRWEDHTGCLINEQALLLQAKITPRHNRLTSGASTKLERRLLEQMQRGLDLHLHRDTARTSLIGKYVLGTSPTGDKTGLKDCARYLLAPKGIKWLKNAEGRSPYQVGWPKSYPYPELSKKQYGFMEAALALGALKTLGRSVTNPPADAWSQLVADLRGGYINSFMPGYGHNRINSSFLSYISGPRHGFYTFRHIGRYHSFNAMKGNYSFRSIGDHYVFRSTGEDDSVRGSDSNFPPNRPPPFFELLNGNPPALPILHINLRALNEHIDDFSF